MNQPPGGPPGYPPPNPYGQPQSPGAPEQQGYGPPPQQQYGAPPQQQGYGPPPQQQQYGAPPPQQGYGPPPQQQQQYGAPPQQQGYGAPPQQRGYGPPPQQMGYGAPPQQQGFAPFPQPGAPMGGLMPAANQQKTAMLAGGGVLLFIALAVGLLFLRNMHQYLTIEDRFSSLPSYARGFGVRLVKEAAMNRMIVFGPLAALFGAGGGVLMFLGLKKK